MPPCLGRAAGSNGALATVHVDRLTIHVRGEIRQKERGDSSYLFRLGQTTQWYVCGKRIGVLAVWPLRDARLCQRCPRDRWVDGIDPDAEWPQLYRGGARERYDTALAGAVAEVPGCAISARIEPLNNIAPLF